MSDNNRKYKHLFFDLDHTLWDFETNSSESLQEIYEEHNLTHIGVTSFNEFLVLYHKHNNHYWEEYRNGNTRVAEMRVDRFVKTLASFNISDTGLAQTLSSEYLKLCPTKQKLFPGAIDLLDYLKHSYRLHIITNGFHEVQMTKLKSCNIGHYFDLILTGDKARALKPAPGIFEQSLEYTGASKKESIYIGDSIEVDIRGAQNAGWDHVFCNHNQLKHKEKVTYEVRSLEELKAIFP